MADYREEGQTARHGYCTGIVFITKESHTESFHERWNEIVVCAWRKGIYGTILKQKCPNLFSLEHVKWN